MSKASQLRQKAQAYLQKGKVDKAIEEYKKLLTVESRNPNLYNELGDIYLRTNDRVQAVSAFEKASLNYEKVALYNNAVAVCKKILRLVPNRLDTIFKLGEIKAKQKLAGEAEVYFLQYFEAVISDPERRGDGVQKQVEDILAMVPDSEGVCSKASDVFLHLGMKLKAAEMLAGLIARNSMDGDPQRLNYYRSRLDILKQQLKRDEFDKVEKIITGGGPEDGHGAAAKAAPDQAPARGGIAGTQADAPEGAEPDESPAYGPAPATGPAIDAMGSQPAAETVGVDSAGISLTDYASDLSGRPAAAADGGTRAPGAGGETRPDSSAEEPRKDEGGAPGRAATPSEDLSDLLEEEDAQIESESSIRNFADEITSDVEQDDFRSHYDLGMAYIEMGLYSDAVKELQISARSEQLQLQSLEMVGHCFLAMSNPRLAVKQLERGLEISQTSGGDSMGIHYNLGLAYEALEDLDKAREHYEEVYIVDVTFRDISDKMKKFSTVS
ncbi:MAG: tetratricopeptide repeat protein [Candidatus Krumholzibacteria bacterium]|nr:tetratricopeptide repeat protein [Candidatus Krumholzibacteria bacterium]